MLIAWNIFFGSHEPFNLGNSFYNVGGGYFTWEKNRNLLIWDTVSPHMLAVIGRTIFFLEPYWETVLPEHDWGWLFLLTNFVLVGTMDRSWGTPFPPNKFGGLVAHWLNKKLFSHSQAVSPTYVGSSTRMPGISAIEPFQEQKTQAGLYTSWVSQHPLYWDASLTQYVLSLSWDLRLGNSVQTLVEVLGMHGFHVLPENQKNTANTAQKKGPILLCGFKNQSMNEQHPEAEDSFLKTPCKLSSRKSYEIWGSVYRNAGHHLWSGHLQLGLDRAKGLF